MTITITAPAWKRIPVVCILCGKHSHKWVHDVDLRQYPHSPLDGAHVYTCAVCKHPATVSANATLSIPRNADPERAAHAARTSGAVHTLEGWRAR